MNQMLHLILMDPCIADYSVETPTRCSFVMEFIIRKFFEGSACLERHTASSSGALNCICSLWFIFPYGDRPFFPPLSLGNGRSPYGHINQRLKIQFRAPDDERCAAWNMLSLQKLWNNKFYYKAASCWCFYWANVTSHYFSSYCEGMEDGIQFEDGAT